MSASNREKNGQHAAPQGTNYREPERSAAKMTWPPSDLVLYNRLLPLVSYLWNASLSLTTTMAVENASKTPLTTNGAPMPAVDVALLKEGVPQLGELDVRRTVYFCRSSH